MIPSDTRPPTALVNGDLVNRVQQLRLGDQLGAAKKSAGGSWLPWVLCGLLALSWAGVGIRSYRGGGVARSDESAAPGGPGPRPIGGATPSSGSGSDASAPTAPGEIVLQLKGNLIPSLQIAVSPRDVAGELLTIRFCEGKLVKKNDVLATLLNAQYVNKFESDEASVASAKAQVARAKAGIKKAEVGVVSSHAMFKKAEADIKNWEAQIILARAELRRAKLAILSSAAAQTDVDKAQATLDANEAQLVAAIENKNATAAQEEAALADVTTAKESFTAAEADLRAAVARLAESQRLLTNCTIVAPIDGTVLTKKADQGSLVSPAAFNVSASLCEIADLSKLEVEVDVPERQITRIRPDLDCQVAADANPNRIYRGRVDRVMPIADDSKSVIKVRVRVFLPMGEAPGSFLKPKMSVVVTAFNRDFVKQPSDQQWE